MQYSKFSVLFYHNLVFKRFGVVEEELVGGRRGKFRESIALECRSERLQSGCERLSRRYSSLLRCSDDRGGALTQVASAQSLRCRAC